MIARWKCLFGFHDFFTKEEEFRPYEISPKGHGDGLCRQEICRECGWERVTQYGYMTVKKPWEMSVKKMKWEKDRQDYVGGAW